LLITNTITGGEKMKRRLRKLTALLLMFAMIFTFVGNSKTTLAANGGSGVQNVNFEALFLALDGTPYESLEITMTGDEGTTLTATSENQILHNVPYDRYTLSVRFNDEALEGFTLRYKQQGSTIYVLTDNILLIDDNTPTVFFVSIILAVVSEGTLKVEKVDDSGNPLANVTFDLTMGSLTRSVTTNSAGVALFENLPFGDYELKETLAPEGYLFNEDPIYVEINSVETVIKRVTNELIRGTVKVTKYDEDENLLEGAEFTLTDGEYTETATTNSAGIAIFEDVPYGEYTLSETEAPEGYVGSPVVKEVVIDGSEEELEFEFVNSLITGTVKVTKYDEYENLLKGAEFTLTDGEYTETATTNSAGIAIFENVPYGEYELSEISAPAGYIKDTESYDVEIKEVGDIVELSVVNKAIRGNILIVKIGDDGEPLQGAEFALYKDGMAVGKALETDDDGEVLFEDVLYGTYEIRETKAPEGYVLTDATFVAKIDKDGETVSLEISNSLITSTVSIKKVEKGTVTGLKGAEFIIEDEEGGVVFTGSTGNDGTLTVILPYGKYIVKESKAPEGYMLDTKSYSVDIKENGQTFNMVVENEKILEDEDIDSKDEEIEPDDEEEGSLPQTGGIPSELLYAVGMIAMAGGVVLMRKKEEK
jgi:LPXTG-motif cell wall-anchored protein